MVVAADNDLSWLPPLVELQHCGGDWPRYCEQLHDIFMSDFVRSTPKFGGKRVAVLGRPYPDGKHLAFWHLTSEGRVEDERTPDMRRCERIRWVRALIDEAQNKSVRIRTWSDTSRGDLRHQLALPDFSYMVVLADKPKFNLLITAFAVEHQHTRDKRRAQYEEAHAKAKKG